MSLENSQINLRVLQLSINNPRDNSFINLQHFFALTVADNKLEGTIERDIGVRLPNLEIFLVTLNQFTGPIPDSVSNTKTC